MHLTPMDYARAAIANALVESLTVTDLWRAAEEAQTAEDFDNRVNAIIQANDAITRAKEAQLLP